jgi:hypothetical protein
MAQITVTYFHSARNVTIEYILIVSSSQFYDLFTYIVFSLLMRTLSATITGMQSSCHQRSSREGEAAGLLNSLAEPCANWVPAYFSVSRVVTRGAVRRLGGCVLSDVGRHTWK